MTADATGNARLTLWQDDVNKLDVGRSYKLEKLQVRTFNRSKYFCPFKSAGWSVNVCDDIGAVHSEDVDKDIGKREILNASIDGAIVDVKLSCLACQSHVQKFPGDEFKLGRCINCSMTL